MKKISKKQRGSSLPLGSIQSFFWYIKEKLCFKQRYFKILLTSLIKTLFADQLSSLGINRQMKTFTLLNFSHKQEPMLTIQSAISKRVSVKRLLVPHNTTTLFSNGGFNRFLVCQSTFSTWSPLIPKFNAFNGGKISLPYFQILRKTCYNGIS